MSNEQIEATIGDACEALMQECETLFGDDAHQLYGVAHYWMEEQLENGWLDTWVETRQWINYKQVH